MSEQAAEAKQLFDLGTPYAQMCGSLGVGPRHLRRLLHVAGVARAAGRPRKHPPGRRVSYEAAGVA